MDEEIPAAQLATLARLLDTEREETSARLDGLTRQFDAIVESSALSASDDEHDPEGSTVGFERAQVAALIDQARMHLGAADRAWERLREGTYGTCGRCGRRIGTDRLMAHPTAATCVACASTRDAVPGRRLRSQVDTGRTQWDGRMNGR